jgi:hypothetical protein
MFVDLSQERCTCCGYASVHLASCKERTLEYLVLTEGFSLYGYWNWSGSTFVEVPVEDLTEGILGCCHCGEDKGTSTVYEPCVYCPSCWAVITKS